MIKQKFYLERYDWIVYAFYGATEQDKVILLDCLDCIGCPQKHLNKIIENIEDGLTDNGFTYSNCTTRQTILVVGEGTSNEEFMNSLVHEARHLEEHIAKTFEMDYEDEERYYLIGKLIQTMYKGFKILLN